ncbi:hypothetical protein P7M39_24560, partial [Vibrio parahaemolyticus]|nr:hypothetical protein [Vibrio parahaemolyticus]
METKDALVLLANSNGVSGQENNLHKVIIELFESLVDEVEGDSLGNLIFYKKSTNKSDFKLMLAAHMDEIGLIVNKIEENGFLRFSEVGGIDKKTLVGQEVLVHGKETILGIIGTKPPHMMSNEEQEKSI